MPVQVANMGTDGGSIFHILTFDIHLTLLTFLLLAGTVAPISVQLR